MEPMLAILLSGTVGALLATAVASAVSVYRERVRLRFEVALAVLDWSDEVYIRLEDLRLHWQGHYAGKGNRLTTDEYNRSIRALNNLLNRSHEYMRLALVFGDSEEVRLQKDLRLGLLDAAKILWSTEHDSWVASNTEVRALFATIDPLRQELLNRLIHSASYPLLWKKVSVKLQSGPEWSSPD